MSSARRAVHDGHQPRPLQQNATTRDSAQSSQVTSTKPNRASPQLRKRSTSSFTREGIAPASSGHPRRKASCSTDFSGARRRPSPASPTSPVYCPPPTFSAVALKLWPRECATTCSRLWRQVALRALASASPMVRREDSEPTEGRPTEKEAESRCTSPAGESPVRVIAGEPESRPPPEAQKPIGEAWRQERRPGRRRSRQHHLDAQPRPVEPQHLRSKPAFPDEEEDRSS